MTLIPDKYNQAVQGWGSTGRALLKTTGSGMGIQHRQSSTSKGESLSKIKDKYGYDSTGFINKVTFTTINRSLIFTSQGAGKGIGGSKGSRWIDRLGNPRKTNPKSLGKIGNGLRTPKPFIDSMLNGAEGLEKLADIVAEHQVDAIIDNVYVK